jgi:hypothetical protein
VALLRVHPNQQLLDVFLFDLFEDMAGRHKVSEDLPGFLRADTDREGRASEHLTLNWVVESQEGDALPDLIGNLHEPLLRARQVMPRLTTDAPVSLRHQHAFLSYVHTPTPITSAEKKRT